MRISRLFKWLRWWSSQAFRKRHSPAAFRTCRNAGNSVLTAEGTTLKGTGSISCEVEFCIFYRLSLRTLQTKDVFTLPTLTSRLAALLACKLILVLFLMLFMCLPHTLTLNPCRLLSMAHLPALAVTVKWQQVLHM
jgi:hypothetical protein